MTYFFSVAAFSNSRWRGDSLHPRDVLAQAADLLQALRLSHAHLELQPEELVVELALLVLRARRRSGSESFPRSCVLLMPRRREHEHASAAAACARPGAWPRAASCGVTPSISNRILPGRTTATQWSGAPLPLPIRVSAGFLVTGLSGNRRIQILPPRLMKRVMATRLASICRSVIQPGSSTFSP